MAITIVMTTFTPPDKSQRQDYAKRCMQRLSKRLKGTTLKFHVADDGSSNEDYLELIKMAFFYLGPSNVTFSQSNRKGVGGSLNLALKQINGWWMYTTDDWLLTEDLDMRPVRVLLDEFGYDLVRIGPIHPDLYCQVKFNVWAGWYLEIDQSKGGFAFATRPFVATKQFYSKIGPFDEGLNAYETERLYAERVAKSNVKIAAINLAGPWEHIGEQEVGDIDPKIILP